VEDEIDLRVYINVLIRYWWLIVGLTVAAGIVAFVVGLLQPAQYQATAVVVVTRPLYQFQLAPGIQNLPEGAAGTQILSGKAALDLAVSDAMIQDLLDQMGSDLPSNERSLVPMRAMLKATQGGDATIIRLTVTNRDPQRVSKIANTWASLYVRQVNDLYGQSAEQLKFFESQLAQAKGDLDAADQALVDFQKRNDAAILQAQLTAKQNALANYLSLNESLKLLLQNVRSLQDQLARQPANDPSTLGDDLSTLALQVNALNAQSGIPIQLQLPSTGTLSNKTVGQQAAYLADLAKTIEAKQTGVKKQADEAPTEIMALQGQIQESNTENARLTRQRDMAQNVYTTLSQKVGETRIVTQDTSGRVRLASAAVVPEKPLGGRLKNTTIAAALGLFLGIVAAFAIEYFKQPQVEPAARPAPVPGK
jgi:succinoglycan biosynthesis transport protein ExoP